MRSLLSEVANMGSHALIDTGALVTGYTNEEVARYLLDHGCEGMDGVVFLDRSDKQMIMLRASYTVLPLAQCGIDPSRRFWSVHTTHSDACIATGTPQLRAHPVCCSVVQLCA